MDHPDFVAVLLEIWAQTQNEPDDAVDVGVMRSICCLFEALPSSMKEAHSDPFRAHKGQCILSHSELAEGKEWDILYQELEHKECLELTVAESKQLRSKSDQYQAIKSKMKSSQNELKEIADKVKALHCVIG